MIEAFQQLRAGRADKDAVLVIAGEGTQRPALEKLIHERKLDGAVFLLGWRDDVLDMHSAFSVFTMSSRSEGTSISLLEAMSAGLAPVVTDVGGNPAVLGDTLRHCLVQSENPAALAAAWAGALADPARLQADRAAARKRVVDAFALNAMVQAYERVYRGGAA
jgi:glycosyltransferase involved in cell wall biosynthesis